MKNLTGIHLSSNKDLWLYVLICFVWGSQLLKIFNAIALRLPGISLIGGSINTILLVIALLLSLPAFLKKLDYGDFIFYISCLSIYVLNYLIFPENTNYLDQDFSVFFINVLPFFFIGKIMDITKLDRLLFIISALSLVIYGYHDVFFESDYIDQFNDDALWISYSRLPYSLYILWYTFRHPKIVTIILSAFSIILSLSYGSRGPIVCVVTFISCYSILFNKYKKRILAYSLIAIVTVLFILYSEIIITSLSLLMERIGMSTRIMDHILNEEFLVSHGRETIDLRMDEALKDGGILGYGINGSYNLIGIYPHKLHIDMWISFGYFLGSLILATLAYFIFSGYKSSNSDLEKGFLVLLTVVGIETLMFSFSYLIWPYFFMLIGYCVGRRKKITLEGESLNPA